MLETKKYSFDVDAVRAEFPVLDQKVYGNKPLIYLDSAASSQKPRSVADAVAHYYLHEHANIHRGVHFLSQQATDKYEEVRKKTRNFINAAYDEEIIFTSGTTDGINLVAATFDRAFIQPGDEVIVTAMEHHSNLVPWQMMCERAKAKLRFVPVSDSGELAFNEYEKLLNSKTKLVAVSHVSNTLGTVNPVKQMAEKANEYGAKVLVDGAQSVPHLKVDVRDLNCDFYAFSAHKMYGPTGVGVLYGKKEILNELPPYRGGGEMIKTVTLEKSTYNDLPHKFEAGTPNIAGVIGLGAAIDFMNRTDLKSAPNHEQAVLEYCENRLKVEFPTVRIFGEAPVKTGAVSFLLGDLHPYDVGVLLDRMGIAVRTGHHCTEPLMTRFDIPGTVRASFGMYNTTEEVNLFIEGLKRAEKMLS